MTFSQDFQRAARANLIPIVLLQCAVGFILWSYFEWPAAHQAFLALADFKARTGYFFAFVAAAFGAAIIPFALQSLQSGSHRRISGSALAVLVLFWGLIGCLVNAFYAGQAMLWGDNAQLSTLIIKVICDQGLFTPLLATPLVAMVYGLVDAKFQWSKCKVRLRGNWYSREVLPLVRMAWLVWIPAVFVIYTLPQDLQFPIQAIIQCLWALLLTVLTDRPNATAVAAD